jgi:electron transport complex protein RnfA
MAAAVLFVLALASAMTWLLAKYILDADWNGDGQPGDLSFLQTIGFILVIAALVQLVEMAIKKMSPTLYQSLGIYLPLITTNCAVLGLAVLNMQRGYTFLESLLNAVGASLGFGLALILFAGLRERLELSDVPKVFRGTALALITAGILSLAFMGFSGLVTAGN